MTSTAKRASAKRQVSSDSDVEVVNEVLKPGRRGSTTGRATKTAAGGPYFTHEEKLQVGCSCLAHLHVMICQAQYIHVSRFVRACSSGMMLRTVSCHGGEAMR